MPTYVAFLRAINLGARRRFPKPDVVAATATVGHDVETYLSTGNVRLTSRRRSAAAVARDLEHAYAGNRGFEVPTVVLTPAEVRDVVSTAEQLLAGHGGPARLSITLYADPPGEAAARAAEGLGLADDVLVRGRAAFVLLRAGFHDSKLWGRKEFRALGEGTARNVTVLREVAARWCQ